MRGSRSSSPGFVRPCQRCRQAKRQHEAGVGCGGAGIEGQRGVVQPRGRGALLPADADIKGARDPDLGQMRPPSLLSLTLDSALLRIAHIADLSNLPDHLVIDLFRRTLSAGKLTEKVLKLFLATGCEEIILAVKLLNIKQPLVPVLPTRCSERF